MAESKTSATEYVATLNKASRMMTLEKRTVAWSDLRDMKVLIQVAEQCQDVDSGLLEEAIQNMARLAETSVQDALDAVGAPDASVVAAFSEELKAEFAEMRELTALADRTSVKHLVATEKVSSLAEAQTIVDAVHAGLPSVEVAVDAFLTGQLANPAGVPSGWSPRAGLCHGWIRCLDSGFEETCKQLCKHGIVPEVVIFAGHGKRSGSSFVPAAAVSIDNASIVSRGLTAFAALKLPQLVVFLCCNGHALARSVEMAPANLLQHCQLVGPCGLPKLKHLLGADTPVPRFLFHYVLDRIVAASGSGRHTLRLMDPASSRAPLGWRRGVSSLWDLFVLAVAKCQETSGVGSQSVPFLTSREECHDRIRDDMYKGGVLNSAHPAWKSFLLTGKAASWLS